MPDKPTGLTATGSGNKAVLAFTPPAGAVSYEVAILVATGDTWAVTAASSLAPYAPASVTVSGAQRQFDVPLSALANLDGRYKFQVRAVDANGVRGDWSTESGAVTVGECASRQAAWFAEQQCRSTRPAGCSTCPERRQHGACAAVAPRCAAAAAPPGCAGPTEHTSLPAARSCVQASRMHPATWSQQLCWTPPWPTRPTATSRSALCPPGWRSRATWWRCWTQMATSWARLNSKPPPALPRPLHLCDFIRPKPHHPPHHTTPHPIPPLE